MCCNSLHGKKLGSSVVKFQLQVFLSVFSQTAQDSVEFPTLGPPTVSNHQDRRRAQYPTTCLVRLQEMVLRTLHLLD